VRFSFGRKSISKTAESSADYITKNPVHKFLTIQRSPQKKEKILPTF